MMISRLATQELQALHAASKNHMLTPQAVVEQARDESSALHNYFEWDDTVAAEEFRIEQARRIIRVAVTVLTCPDGVDRKVRAFVSLKPDQADGKGYRAMGKVLSNAKMRKQLLDSAYADLERFQKRYADLQELASVFDAIAATLPKRKQKRA